DRARAGAGRDAPAAAVPVLNERLIRAAVAVLIRAHGPHIVSGDRRYPLQPIVACAGVGTGHHAPTAAVPMLGHRLGAGAAHSPNVVGRHHRHTAETARSWAGHYAPAAAVPV